MIDISSNFVEAPSKLSNLNSQNTRNFSQSISISKQTRSFNNVAVVVGGRRRCGNGNGNGRIKQLMLVITTTLLSFLPSLVVILLISNCGLVEAGPSHWTVGLASGESSDADQIAHQSGCLNLGLVRGFSDVFLFERREIAVHDLHRTKRTLESQPLVLWVDQQHAQTRVKRDLFTRLSKLPQVSRFIGSVQQQQQQQQQQQHHHQQQQHLIPFKPLANANPNAKQIFIGPLTQADHLKQLQTAPAILHQQQQQQQLQIYPGPPVESDNFNDDLWRLQWYLKDSSNVAVYQSDIELKVEDVWRMGYTGKGVVVTILDDGLEWNHTDILPNYDPRASWDMNNNRSDPFPRYDQFDSNSHGTRCAGEVAMVANNRKCGVGVAPGARIGGIKCLDGEVGDRVEAESLLHNIDYIDIYSGSWGPPDNGQIVDGPKRLATEAFEMGTSFGRQGKGVLYVWANGNGGSLGDNCNCDGYVNSIYTISIGGVTQQGQTPFYGERCASTMAVTCSSGAYNDRKIVTTDLHNKCTVDYTGTSAAAPLAAGVYALMLEANRNLTWRDAQHLTTWTSNPIPIRDNPGWKRNAAGLIFNQRFGFGLLNAKALVDAALQWKGVPRKSICIVQSSTRMPLFLRSKNMIRASFITDGCQQRAASMALRQQQFPQQFNANNNNYNHNYNYKLKLVGNQRNLGLPGLAMSFESQQQLQLAPVIYLEHVQVIIDLEYTSRGFLEIFLISPSGTVSTLLSRRPFDESRAGFDKWSLMSVHFWAETAIGEWILIVRDKEGNNQRGLLRNATLVLHGTHARPAHMAKQRLYDADELLIKDFLDPVLELEEGDLFDLNTFPNEMSLVRDESYQPTFIKSVIAMEQLNKAAHADSNPNSNSNPINSNNNNNNNNKNNEPQIRI